jgi:hypothetical protein
MVTLGLPEERVTANPPLGAAFVSVIVQSDEPGVLIVDAAQLRPLSVTGAIRFRVAVRVRPFQLALAVAVWSTLSVPAVTVKFPLLAPALIVKLRGTLRVSVLLVKAMVAVVVAALVRATVQVVLCPLPKVSGVQFSVDKRAGATRFNEKVREIPPAVAVRTAFWSVSTAAAVAVNPALAAPAGTVTVPGAVRFELLDASVTAKPLPVAALDSITVHSADPGVSMLDTAQDRPLNVTGAARFTTVVRVCPFQAALIVAGSSAAMVPAVALKFRLSWLGLKVRVDGTLRVCVLLARLIVMREPGVFVNVTVQVALAPLTNVSGEQLTADNRDATRFSEVVRDTPEAAAVSTAL